MRVSGYTKTILLILLLVAPMLAEAGEWNGSCAKTGSVPSCDDITNAASRSVTEAFTSKYPHEKYLILFTVTSSEYGDGYFSYSVFASLHAKRDKGRWLRFPSISGHSNSGTHSNPSFALQRQLLLKAAERAMAALVSDVTGR